jgi:hypothetical protein
MKEADDFSAYHRDLLEGRYDCVDRLVLNGYFPMGQTGGGFRTWWRSLTGGDGTLDQEHLLRLSGRFSRRLHAYAKAQNIPVIHCAAGERKHEIAERHLPKEGGFSGLFLIIVAKAPALVWEVKPGKNGCPHLERRKPWPYVNHYHFHFIDREWGHLTIKMSGHPPFGVQVMLNGHEWVERQARQQAVSFVKEGNCFVEGSLQALDQLADTLCAPHAIGRLAEVCDRWVYSSCLCFGLDLAEQKRTGFAYQYSCYQLEYSRNLLFTRGSQLDEVYQGMIERTRRLLDVDRLKTILGWKHRPRKRCNSSKAPCRIERVIDESTYDLTVFKVHFGHITLKVYDKGERVLRVEALVHNVTDLRCGKVLGKLSMMLEKLQRMTIDFLNTLQAAHGSFLDEQMLDALPAPTQRGNRRLAGVDLQKPRLRRVTEAVIALAPQPGGFSVRDLAGKVNEIQAHGASAYTPRQAAYDLSKMRAKQLVERVAKTRKYRIHPTGIRTLAGLFILREKVIRPVLAGLARPSPGRPPKNIHPLDVHYATLQREMLNTLRDLSLAA